ERAGARGRAPAQARGGPASAGAQPTARVRYAPSGPRQRLQVIVRGTAPAGHVAAAVLRCQLERRRIGTGADTCVEGGREAAEGGSGQAGVAQTRSSRLQPQTLGPGDGQLSGGAGALVDEQG